MVKPSLFTRILGVNLLILLLLGPVLRLSVRGSDAFITLMAYELGVQVFINLVLAFKTHSTAARQAHWLSLLLVLLVGFGMCVGSALYY